MPSPPACPVCAAQIDKRQINIATSFRCPHCNELLRERRPLGQVGSVVALGGITLGLLTQVLGVVEWFVVLFLFPFAVLLIQAVLVRLFGHTLEPATESGRIPLGE